MERTGVTVPRALTAALATLLVLAPGACTLPGAGPREPHDVTTSAPPRTPPATADDGPPSADDLRAGAEDTGTGIGVATAEGVTAVGPQEAADGSVRLTWTTRDGPAADATATAVAHLVAPEGWTLEPTDDGSVVAYDEDGVARAGGAPPRAEAAPGAPTPRVVPETVADDVVTLTLDRGSVAAGSEDDATLGAAELGEVEVSLELSAVALTSADWGEREGGRSLAVVPTDWAREAGEAGLVLLWDQVRAAEPEADSAVMHDQLVCHSIGAPDKAAWNLEPWRPDVGLLAVLAARCNPT